MVQERVVVASVKKRTGEILPFDDSKIRKAISKAFVAESVPVDEATLDRLTAQVTTLIGQTIDENVIPTVEQIQDLVEIVLLKNSYVKIAKSYILYRAKHQERREERTKTIIKERKLMVKKKDGSEFVFDSEQIRDELEAISIDLSHISIRDLVDDITKVVYNGISAHELRKAIINAAKTKIERHYNYSYLAARLQWNELYLDILHDTFGSSTLKDSYCCKFKQYIALGVEHELLDRRLMDTFDLERISEAINANRDKLFMYLGAETVHARYLLRTSDHAKRIFELPQWMWMRIAMGLALDEKEKEEKAIEFYHALSQMYVVSSTPTLFNSGTVRMQMSSCFLNTVGDSLVEIFKNYSDNALLSKWAGGIGTDWTQVRSKNALIKGTNGMSQGIVPFIRIFNDTAVAVNQGGKRKGAMATYLEIWHRDIEEYLELRKNTGDERRRAHDIHTAVWVPDLFMKRVQENADWTLFSPNTVPELHDLYGKRFEEKYVEYESKNVYGSKKMPALELWKKTLSMLFETGHPWITFKDPCNVRSPQDHAGVVHCSNLCTEITLNTSKDETAVCNLASLNLARMIDGTRLDETLLKKSVRTAVRMLNNVVDLNLYTIPEAKTSNLRHRPVGLGLMGYQDALYKLGIDFDSEQNVTFADRSMEMVSYYAILASSELAKEFSPYKSFKGSKWDRGILPIDTIDLLEKERGQSIEIDRGTSMDWSKVREHIKAHGMRNSNVMAIAPTATIANIAGVVPCVEPIYKNIYMKENMDGNFLVINGHLIDELEKRSLWTPEMLTKIKYYDGSVLQIDEIPADLRSRFREIFEIDAEWILKCAAKRGKWIDQSASTNIFMRTTSGRAISNVYMSAWRKGLKTTYYLRTLSATQVTKTISLDEKKAKEKVDVIRREADTAVMDAKAAAPATANAAAGTVSHTVSEPAVKACALNDPDCEACQ